MATGNIFAINRDHPRIEGIATGSYLFNHVLAATMSYGDSDGRDLHLCRLDSAGTSGGPVSTVRWTRSGRPLGGG